MIALCDIPQGHGLTGAHTNDHMHATLQARLLCAAGLTLYDVRCPSNTHGFGRWATRYGELYLTRNRKKIAMISWSFAWV